MKPKTISVAFPGYVVFAKVNDHKNGFKSKAVYCPKCFKLAVVKLPPWLKAEQPDDTTHVCHPVLNGCNHGFSQG